MYEMNEEKCDIGELISQCLDALKENEFSEQSIRRYKYLWKRGIVAFLNKRRLSEYTPSIGESFCLTCNHEGVVTKFDKALICSVAKLNEILLSGELRLRYKTNVVYHLYGCIGEKMELFVTNLKNLRLKENTIKLNKSYLFRFLSWLEDNEIESIDSITEHHVMIFLGNYERSCKARMTSVLRGLFKFWYENNIFRTNMEGFFKSFRPQKHEKLPSFYTKDEVMRIETSVDRASAIGKRNYCMLLFASRLGLRAADIAAITFENIDWGKNLISLTMQKTNRQIELPLLPEVGNAMIDYLKYGRRKHPSRAIFLTACAPYRPVTAKGVSCVIAGIITKSCVNTGNRRHGSHSMRFSLATAMLANAVSMSIISESLGHVNSTATMKYLGIDLASLMKCAISVPLVSEDFYTQKGGVFYE